MRKEEGDKVIEQLMVKDYILFESALIDYNTGMSVITGETGAGKSLLIDAIGYLMGNRIQGNIIRKGKEKCILQMVLSKPSPAVCQQLEDNGFEVDDVLIIQRTINQQQKSTIRINQQITTNHFVRQIVSQIVDIHSQQDTFYLMDSSVQLDLSVINIRSNVVILALPNKGDVFPHHRYHTKSPYFCFSLSLLVKYALRVIWSDKSKSAFPL